MTDLTDGAYELELETGRFILSLSKAEEILRGSFKEGTKIIAKHVEDAEELVFYDESLEKESPSEEPEKSDTN